MALAPRRTLSASTLDPQQFQLFQPRGEVRAIVSPTRMRKGFSAAPLELAAFSTTRYSVFAGSLPVIRPVLGSSRRPAGRSVAEKESGRSPVAGIRYRKGELGRRPKMEGPLIRVVSERWRIRGQERRSVDVANSVIADWKGRSLAIGKRKRAA
jgi:hypothetical protein